MKISALAAALMLSAASLPAQAGEYNWTGFYIGAHGGHSSAAWNGNLTYKEPSAPTVTAADIFGDTSRSMDATAAMFGGQIGYNRQFGNIVIGIEADASHLGADTGKTFTSANGLYDWDISTKVKGMESVRARLGLAMGSFMVFATGGVAIAHTEGTLEVTSRDGFSPALVTAVGKSSDTHVGWTLGGGAEWAVTQNVLLTAQYTYSDFGSEAYHLKGTAYPNGPFPSMPHTTDSFPADLTVQTVRVGVNFKLN